MNPRVIPFLSKTIAISVAISFSLSAVMAFIDWKENPGGLFRNQERTHWSFVSDTFQSWFWPTLLLLLPISILVALAVAYFRKRSSSNRKTP